MLDVLAVQHEDADLGVVREARRRLVIALAGLLDLPAYAYVDGLAQSTLDRLATLLGQPDLRLPD